MKAVQQVGVPFAFRQGRAHRKAHRNLGKAFWDRLWYAPPMIDTHPLRTEYAARLNRVLDHVQGRLDEPLDLKELARVACFSPFHFHRLFRSWTGETLQQYLQRLRLERAAHQLRHNPGKAITEIALDAGFSGSAAFARAFRERFGVSASAFRLNRKAGKAEASHGVGSSLSDGLCAAFRKDPAMFPLTVQVQNLPPMSVAYVRHIGPYKGNAELFGRLFGQLCGWAGPKGLLGPDATFLSLYHDDPELTADPKLRLEVAVTVPPATPAEGEIGRMELAGGRYAMARIAIQPQQYEAAWQALMSWLPESGFQPDDRPAMEIYRNDPKQDPEGRHILDLCMPVRPL